MPRMEEATADFSYIRWLGDRREFREGHTYLKKDRDVRCYISRYTAGQE
jgi:hypothetical protein